MVTTRRLPALARVYFPVIKEFEKHGTLLENYDVYSCDSDVSDEIHFGYSSMKLALVGLTQYYWNY